MKMIRLNTAGGLTTFNADHIISIVNDEGGRAMICLSTQHVLEVQERREFIEELILIAEKEEIERKVKIEQDAWV